MPGPCEADRLLALELAPGALDGAHGMIRVGMPRRPARRVAAAAAVANAA